MKKQLSKFVEDGREQGLANSGPYGHFFLYCPITKAKVFIIASDGRDWHLEGLPGNAWEHASVSADGRCPTWREMNWVKMLFWNDDECVIQFHPPKADYVNLHPFVLHLWKPVGIILPMPPIKTV